LAYSKKVPLLLFLIIFYFNSREGENLKTGTILSLRKGFSYYARWFDPITDVWAVGSNLSVSGTGECALPHKPTGQDWVLIVEESK
jgi:hypothetical protein